MPDILLATMLRRFVEAREREDYSTIDEAAECEGDEEAHINWLAQDFPVVCIYGERGVAWAYLWEARNNAQNLLDEIGVMANARIVRADYAFQQLVDAEANVNDEIPPSYRILKGMKDLDIRSTKKPHADIAIVKRPPRECSGRVIENEALVTVEAPLGSYAPREIGIIAKHELGHILGVHYDSYGGNCAVLDCLMHSDNSGPPKTKLCRGCMDIARENIRSLEKQYSKRLLTR